MTRKSILLFITCVTLVAANAAAYTYVVAALSSLGTLLYYVMIYSSGSRR